MLMTHEPLLRLPDRFIFRRGLGWLPGRGLPSLLGVPFVAPTVALLMTVGFTAPSLAQEPVFSNDGMLWEGEAVTGAKESVQGAANELGQDRAVLALDAALNLNEHSQLILAEPGADEVAQRMAPGNSPGKDADRQAQQTGFAREVQGFEQLRPAMAGTRRDSDGQDYSVSQRLVGSQGAVSIRLHFSGVHLPAGARLYVYGLADGDPQHNTQPRGYDSGWLGNRTSFWSQTITGDRAVVEYHTPLDSGTTDGPASYTVDRVVHNVVDIFGRNDGATSKAVGTCHLNMCDYPAWRSVGDGVVRLHYIIDDGRTFICSGALLNDQADSGTPYIYTANHCISTQSEASTVEVGYFHQRNLCSDNPDSNRVTRLGSTLLATGGSARFAGDYTLLRADATAPNGVAFLGWTTANAAHDTPVTGIHHPQGEFKRISFGRLNRERGFGHPNRYPVLWNEGMGIVEGGSSGSPLIINTPDTNPQVIGTLQGSFNTCSAQHTTRSSYGRFAEAWPFFQPFLDSSAVPDLIVDLHTVTERRPTLGAEFTIKGRVVNRGEGKAAATTLRYVRSDDRTITADDTELATGSVDALLPGAFEPDLRDLPGAFSEESAMVSISETGTWWVGVCVDTVSGESVTNNNCSGGAMVTVMAPPQPDLTVDTVSISESILEIGDTFTLNATVRNSGGTTAAATTLTYYRSTNNTISTGDTELATDTVSVLAADGSSQESAEVSIANTGNYWVGACVATVAGESVTNNNCSDGVQVTVTAPPVVVPTLPDLTVDNIRVSDTSVQTGVTFTINATARNSGDGASAATTLRYYRSTNNTITTDDSELTTDAVGALAAGGSSQESAVVSITNTGTWWVGACISTVSDETETGNNCSDGVQVTVTAPDLTVNSISVAEPSVEADAAFTINATVQNQGTAASVATTLHYYGSDDSTITASDTQLATKSVEALAADTSLQQSAEVVIADAGSYWVGACVAEVNNESATDNNCSAGVPVTVTARPDNNDDILPLIIQLLLLP